MEGYFARLAERAAHTDAPPLTPARSADVADPFAETLSVEPALPPPGTMAPVDRLPPRHLVASHPPQRVVETTHIVHETSVPVSRVTLDVPPPPLPAPGATAAPPREASEPRAIDGRAPVPPPLPQRLVPEVTAHRETTALPHEPAASPQESPVPREEEDRAEEIRLLRKADSFMEQIVGRRHTPAPERDQVEPASLSPEAATQDAQPQSRLQPMPPPRPPGEPEAERTTLTIGRLTVEVIPPAPLPPTPQPTQIVVVRGARGGRSGVPSSRRFGFRQF